MKLIEFPMSREVFESRRVQMADKGMHLDGDSGEVRKNGFKIGYAYDGELLKLSVKRGFLAPGTEDEAVSKIQDWLGVK